MAGGGVVHLVGGIAALVGAIFAGPRNGRFIIENGKRVPKTIRGHSILHEFLGVWILIYGFFLFNSTAENWTTYSQVPYVRSRIALNIVICCAFACFATIPLSYAFHKKILHTEILNNILAGAVATTSNAAFIEPWAAAIMGILSTIMQMTLSWTVSTLCS